MAPLLFLAALLLIFASDRLLPFTPAAATAFGSPILIGLALAAAGIRNFSRATPVPANEKVYRFVSTPFPDGLSCERARRHGWPVDQQRSRGLVLRDQRVPCDAGIARTFSASLPAYTREIRYRNPGWDKLPAGPASKRFGDAWAAANSSLGLLVPSVVGFRGEEPDPQPIAPAISRSARPIQAAHVLDKKLYSIPAKRRSSAQKKNAVAATPIESDPCGNPLRGTRHIAL